MNKSKTVIIRIEPELHRQLVMEATELGITLSEHVRQILVTVPVIGTVKDGAIEWRKRGV